MSKSQQARACDISPRTRQRVSDRDGKRCVICGSPGVQIAHYIPRSRGGLGIPQNLVCLCVKCHDEYDNGKFREKHGQAIREYLKGWYTDWDETDLVYDKYSWLKGGDENEAAIESIHKGGADL